MTRRRLLGICMLPAIAGLIVVGAIALFGMHTNAAGDTTVPPHPNALTNASMQQVAQVALNEVQSDFAIQSGTPQVVLTKAIARGDLPKLNLPSIPGTSIEDPPLMLVIIKGDFGSSTFPSIAATGPAQHYAYVGYVYDLWAGVPTVTLASRTGGEFRAVLNDPTLPVEPIPAGTPFVSPAALHHYGEVVSTVAPHQYGTSQQPATARAMP
jgi:hypothetical protein